jgi:hypothetical protein
MLLILSLTTASVSVLATLSALYWFVKMRRSFRHEYVDPRPGAVLELQHQGSLADTFAG